MDKLQKVRIFSVKERSYGPARVKFSRFSFHKLMTAINFYYQQMFVDTHLRNKKLEIDELVGWASFCSHAGKYCLINIHVYFYATLRFQVLQSTCLKLHGFFSLVKHKHHQPFKIESCISKHTIAIVVREWREKIGEGRQKN